MMISGWNGKQRDWFEVELRGYRINSHSVAIQDLEGTSKWEIKMDQAAFLFSAGLE
jgi:hypothetical protein